MESQVSRHLETVASLTTRLEQAEVEVKNAETRFHDTLAQLERETILCKDRDQTIKSLDDEVTQNCRPRRIGLAVAGMTTELRVPSSSLDSGTILCWA